jgi:hypothetical protein
MVWQYAKPAELNFSRRLPSPSVASIHRPSPFFTVRLSPSLRATSFCCWLFESAQDRAMHDAPRKLKTFDEVVDEFGGPRKLGELVEQNTAAVCNWKRRRKKFPTKYYKVMIEELNTRHAAAPDKLWGFYEKNKKR